VSENRHSGINMHKLSVGAGFPGLLFTLGCGLIFVLGLPALWYFVAFSTALGLAVAAILHLSSSHRSERMKPLSILSTREKAETKTLPEQSEPRSLFRTLPQPYSA
jgi:hypothetical protein